MRPNDTEMQTSEALFTKIYAVRVFEVSRIGRLFVIPGCATWRRPGIHTPIVVMDSGLAHCAPRNAQQRTWSPIQARGLNHFMRRK